METTHVKTTHNQSVDDRELEASALKLLDKLIKIERNNSDIQPGEITIQDYKNKIGLSRSRASMRLNRLVDEGVLTSRIILHCGRRRKVYRDANYDK